MCGCRNDRPRQTQPAQRGASAFSARVSTAALLLLVLSACTRQPETPPTAQSSILRISQRNEPSDLDPATAALPDEFFIIRALGEGLLTPDPQGGDPIPAAAERFDVSPDGLTYTFHLRSAQWSNGDALTADDFIASARRVLTPATAAPKAHLYFAVAGAREYASGTLTDFARVGFRAVDARTLRITLRQAQPGFPRYVASGAWIPTHAGTVARHGRAWTQPKNHVGNGPFTLAEWQPQQRILVRRNPRYRESHRVRLEEIHFVRFDSQDAEERAYRAGQLDVTMAVPQTKLDGHARERPDELHRAPLAETRFLAFNTTRPPLSDVRVRRALALAIDRDRITALVLRGGQRPANRYLSPALLGTAPVRDGQGAATELPSAAHRYAPAEARRLLAEAGFPNGSGFPRLELSGWGQNPVLEAIQQMWRQELHIDVAITVHEAKVHLAALHTAGYDIAFATNLLDVPDPVSALHDFTTGAPNNFPHWTSGEFDQRVAAALHAPPESAARHVAAAEELLLDAAAVTPLYFNVQNWLMSPRIKNWQQDALWTRRYTDLLIGPR